MTYAINDIAYDAIYKKRALQELSSFSGLLSFLNGIHRSKCLEIGSAYGGTLWAWSQLFNSVYAITRSDIGDGNDWNPLNNYGAHMIYGYSQDPAIIEEARECGPYDFVFVDGDHSLTAADIRNYLPMTKYLAVHDINTFSADDWGMATRQYEHIVFPGRMGIGLIWRQ